MRVRLNRPANIHLNDDDSPTMLWHDRGVDVAGSDRLVERLHRLLVVLEDESRLNDAELPPLAIFDARLRRWLLVSGVSVDRLREPPEATDDGAHYLIVVGEHTFPVCSADDSSLMAEFTRTVRIGVIS